MSHEKPYLSVVVPAYCEEKRLGPTLERLHRYFTNERKDQYSYEILVVNDGSTDGTAAVVRDFQTKMPELNLLDRHENKGKGYSIKEGMLVAKGEFRVFADADNSTDIAHLDLFVSLFKEGRDVVIGSRHTEGANIVIPQPWYRVLLGRGGNLLTRILVARGIYDTQCGFKGLSAKACERIFPAMVIDGWGFDMEIVALAKRYGFSLEEVGVRWLDNEDSTVPGSAFFLTLLDLFRIRWRLWFGGYKS